MYVDPKDLTPTEWDCYVEQMCSKCKKRRYERDSFERPVLLCTVGMKWPKRGYCRGFVLDEEVSQ